MVESEVNWPELVALGEPMVEFNQTGQQSGRLFLQGFGGDTSNFAVAAARQGAQVGYLSAIGEDPYGQMLRQLWDHEGIDHAGVKKSNDAFTAIYFVTHDTQGHHFHFFRKGSAASLMQPDDLDAERIRNAKALHFSGISLAISEGARQTCWEAVRIARDNHVLVSFDTNLRLKLWSLEEAKKNTRHAISLCDICLPSLDDMTVITGKDNPNSIIEICHEWGAPLVALKMGDKGALISDGTQLWEVPALECIPVDATGAGDTFGGSFVYRLLQGDSPAQAGLYAATAAALSTEGYGAVEPIPHKDKVIANLKQDR
jgi:2-dehydro-3-deoxygluconokinase